MGDLHVDGRSGLEVRMPANSQLGLPQHKSKLYLSVRMDGYRQNKSLWTLNRMFLSPVASGLEGIKSVITRAQFPSSPVPDNQPRGQISEGQNPGVATTCDPKPHHLTLSPQPHTVIPQVVTTRDKGPTTL